jgi:hypothetical protein
MSQSADNETVECEEILLRAILKRKHFSGGHVTADAFVLRPQDEGKLSTYRQRIVTSTQCKDSFSTCVGVVTLHAGRVRAAGQENDLKIDVVGDSLPGDPLPGHASIVNLPDPRTNFALAEWVASKLRDESRSAIA